MAFDILAQSSREYQPISRSEDGGASSGEDSDKHARVTSWKQRLQRQLSVYHLSFWWYVIKWFIPAISMMLSFLVQNVCLHIATNYYIERMVQAEDVTVHCSGNRTDSPSAHAVAQGTLRDIAAESFGHHDVPTSALDLISGLVPALWLLIVVHDLNLNLFTKCCLCGSFLALGKGFIGIATVVPDSGGWSNCKARLGKDGIEWFRHLHLEKESWRKLAALVRFEFLGTRNKHIRYCADMVYSGHTYCCMLFALGLYDAWSVSILTVLGLGARRRHIFRIILAIILSSIVIIDFTLILMNQFHYTVDVLLALFAVYLFYTNALVSRAATFWATELWVPSLNRDDAERLCATTYLGNVVNPPCFCLLPFCFMSSRYHVEPEVSWSSNRRLTDAYLINHPERFLELVADSVQWAKGSDPDEWTNRDIACTTRWHEWYSQRIDDVKRHKGDQHDVTRQDLFDELQQDPVKDMYDCGNLCQTLCKDDPFAFDEP